MATSSSTQQVPVEPLLGQMTGTLYRPRIMTLYKQHKACDAYSLQAFANSAHLKDVLTAMIEDPATDRIERMQACIVICNVETSLQASSMHYKRAFKAVGDVIVQLAVAGGGEEMARVEALRKQLELRSRHFEKVYNGFVAAKAQGPEAVQAFRMKWRAEYGMGRARRLEAERKRVEKVAEEVTGRIGELAVESPEDKLCDAFLGINFEE